MICLISQLLLIASRRDWYRLKGLLKGFKLALRPSESSKNWWRYDRMKFVTLAISNDGSDLMATLLDIALPVAEI